VVKNFHPSDAKIKPGYPGYKPLRGRDPSSIGVCLRGEKSPIGSMTTHWLSIVDVPVSAKKRADRKSIGPLFVERF
jgi:hypothetical protein